jgi:hypothetical protein
LEGADKNTLFKPLGKIRAGCKTQISFDVCEEARDIRIEIQRTPLGAGARMDAVLVLEL